MNRLEITKSAKKELACFSPEIRRQLGDCIRALQNDPFPKGVKKLKGASGESVYRVRSGDYRILYSKIKDLIIIVAVGNRKDVYR